MSGIDHFFKNMTEKETTVLVLRSNGVGYAAIGKVYGVSGERAKQIANKAARKLAHPSRLGAIRNQYPQITVDSIFDIVRKRGKNV